MNSSEDLRIVKTKLAIKNAFFELLDEKPFEKIAVKDITSRAMINRGTFYLHYDDKYDLVDKLEQEIAHEAVVFKSLITVESVKKSAEAGVPLPHLAALLEFIESNPAFFGLLVKDENRMLSMYRRIGLEFYEQLCECLASIGIEAWTSGEGSMFEYRKEAAVAITSSVIFRWLSQGCDTEKEEIASLITKLIWDTIVKQ